jgi:hypothetical protein
MTREYSQTITSILYLKWVPFQKQSHTYSFWTLFFSSCLLVKFTHTTMQVEGTMSACHNSKATDKTKSVPQRRKWAGWHQGKYFNSNSNESESHIVNVEEEEGYEDGIEPLLQECIPLQSCHTKHSSAQVTHNPSSPSASDEMMMNNRVGYINKNTTLTRNLKLNTALLPSK